MSKITGYTIVSYREEYSFPLSMLNFQNQKIVAHHVYNKMFTHNSFMSSVTKRYFGQIGNFQFWLHI